ncbi:putative phospholipid metabolism enzyme regulator [Aspergillus clavatus NRRL 1]|uniref:Phospholipid metabolism enzyme regulator, putative n=1 Tax=Aspergillus clavatus (strain ATCC 1007 / CBS 513.65 / DSM 816 / NCTC 3887 / NRRL 1 / QM 1276 / 107) TaxID=344612 RepID=A1CSM5_ASPCL|nr:phospholipid metabolism enzyme regulator, putative [Aspergillus clavatus NRRL 1]EAW06312.1 phospholipid metabolism enzyme regulator, putative [Aspergillus clavatus NRRL 1]
MAAESERSPYPNGSFGGPRVAQGDEPASSASRRSASESDMVELPRSAFKSQTQASVLAQLPKLSSAIPAISAPPSTTNSTLSSRESSPVRSSSRARNPTSAPRVSKPRRNSLDHNSHPSIPAQITGAGTVPSATVVQRALSQPSKPPVLSPSPNVDPSPNVADPDKASNMPLWGSTPPNISSKRSLPPSDDLAARGDRSVPRAVSNRINGPGSALETVEEMVSDPSTPSADTILNQPLPEESRLQNIDEETTPKASRHHNESGSDSGGGNKSSERMEDTRRWVSSGTRGAASIIPKRSTASLTGGRGKHTEGSVRNMIVETETVTSIPQVSLGVVPGERGTSGRVDNGTLRMKPSTETIRPRKEKRRTRKPAALTSGAASSKADIFEAKVASAVDEADVSDSDETFVYESNPPDPYPVRPSRYHSRTPSATSMASQVDQLAGRARHSMRDTTHSVTGKRSMKFTNNYTSSVDGDAAEEGGRPLSRVEGGGTHTPRHHHIGRYGRSGNVHPSLFDSDSPFPQSQAHSKSPRHFIGSGLRQSRHANSRGLPNYRTINGNKKAGDMYGYDFDAEGADDERTPLVGSARVARSRHGARRPNSASLRQMEYMQQRQRGCFSRNGVCLLIGLLLLLIVGGATSFIVGITKSLQDVQILAIQNVLASEQEIMLDLSVQAVNPNLFPVAVEDLDVSILAKSRFVGTEKLDLDQVPRTKQSRKRAELAQHVRCSRDNTCTSDQSVNVTGGVDKGTDPIPTDPAGDPHPMSLGRVFRFDSPLLFESSPWNHLASTSKGQLRLARPGNETEEGDTERWERVLQHPFQLIVRGVIKYQLPLSSRYYSAPVSSSVMVVPNEDNDGTPDPDSGNNGTVSTSATNLYRRTLSGHPASESDRQSSAAVKRTLETIARAFTA